MIREARFRRPPKTAHRTHPLIKLWTAHPIDVWVKRERLTPRRPGRKAGAARRGDPPGGARARPGAGARVPDRGPSLPAALLRAVPEEDRDRRRRTGCSERNAEARALHDAYEAGRLEEVYENLTPRRRDGRPGAGRGMAGGGHRAFATTSSPARASSRTASRRRALARWPEERREAALAELREDGMYAISRYMQTVASKKRKRHMQARELKRLRAWAEGVQARDPRAAAQAAAPRTRSPAAARESQESRWWRMRPRLPKRRRAGH